MDWCASIIKLWRGVFAAATLLLQLCDLTLINGGQDEQCNWWSSPAAIGDIIVVVDNDAQTTHARWPFSVMEFRE